MSEHIIFSLFSCGVGFLCGTLAGIIFESNFGRTRQTMDRYRDIVLRMIPKLRENFTANYIYWELVHDNKTDYQPKRETHS